MKRGSDLHASGLGSLAPLSASRSKFLWVTALAGLALTSARGQAQQPYGYGPPAQDAPGQYAQPGAPYGQPQYAQPQYPQPQYGQPQNPQPQYAQPQYPQLAYPQQPAQQYADQGQTYGQPYGQTPDLGAPPAGPTQAPLSANDLEQLLAPIALYPDNLLAQILAASTYPAQVAAADQWVRQMQAQDYGSPEQIAAGADSENGWDPSVKGLTAFPQVLEMLSQNLNWTTALGNAYYNQPQDVMQTVQVLRERAQQAGNLETTPQEDVSEDQGYIDVAPANPQVVYVPAYDPWDVYGAPIAPYPGYSVLGALGSFFGGALVQFGPGIAVAAFDRFPFGWLGWGLSWLSHAIFFNHGAYYTHSTTVADWGFPHGGQRVFGARGWGNHTPQPYNRFGGYATARGAAEMRGPYRGEALAIHNGNGSGWGREFGSTRPVAPGPQAYKRTPSTVNRPENYAQRPQEPARGGNFVRPAYGYGYAGQSAQGFAGRPATGYAHSYPGYRGPSYQAPSYREPAFREPAYRAPAIDSSRAFTGRNEPVYGNFARSERSGGFHSFDGGRAPRSFRQESFGGGHASKGFGHERAPKAPKESHSGGHGHWR
jgi:hypothetical protein